MRIPYFYSAELGYVLSYADSREELEELISSNLTTPIRLSSYVKEILIYNALQAHIAWVRELEVISRGKNGSNFIVPQDKSAIQLLYPEIYEKFSMYGYEAPAIDEVRFPLEHHLSLRDQVRALMSESSYLGDIECLIKISDKDPDKYYPDETQPQRIFSCYTEIIRGLEQEIDLFPYQTKSRDGGLPVLKTNLNLLRKKSNPQVEGKDNALKDLSNKMTGHITFLVLLETEGEHLRPADLDFTNLTIDKGVLTRGLLYIGDLFVELIFHRSKTKWNSTWSYFDRFRF